MPNTPFSIFHPEAKGRSGGSIGGGVSSVNDNWDAPPLVKAEMAFYILWAIAYIVSLVLIIQRLGKLPNFSARIPFIIAAVVLFLLIIVAIISAVAIRIGDTISYKAYNGLWSSSAFFLSIEVGFRPAAVLLWVHQKGKLIRSAQGKTTNPIVSQFWKRILDWALVAVGCLVYLTDFAINTHLANMENLTFATYENYRKALLGFGHMITVMVILLAIDVFVSLIMLYVSNSRAKFSDPTIGKLLFIAGPAFLIYAIENMAFDIYFSLPKDLFAYYSNNYYGAQFAQVFLDGLCRIVIFGALISVMVPTSGAPINNANYGAPNMANAGYPVQPQGWQYQPQPYANPGMPQQYPQQFPQPYSIPTSVQTSVAPAQPHQPTS